MMSGRTLGILLGVSVALNVFCLGVVAARARQRWEWRERSHAEYGAPQGPQGPRRAPRHGRGDPMSWLTESDRAVLRPERKALQGLRHDAAEELRAESFDAEKLGATLDALRAQTTKVQAAVHALLIRRAQTLGPAERRKLADSGWGGPPDHAPDP
jgi:uncharacterized membrane protein